MTTTLTDRYVAALTKLLPSRQRKDIGSELRASIADAVDERLESGASIAQAERAVLTELGDPVLLAASYTDRPTALIGPRLYGDYRRVLGALVTAGPGVAIMVVIGQLLYATPLLPAIVTGLGIGLAVSVAAVVFVTAIFALIERLPRRDGSWKPTNLHESDDSVANSVAGLAFVLAIVALLVLSLQFTSVTDAAGEPVTVIAPALWPAWAPVIIGILVVAVAFTLVTSYFGWAFPIAILNTVVVLAGSALFLFWATNDLFLNPAFFEAIGWDPGAPGTITVIAIVLLLINALVEIIGGFVKASRRAVSA